MKNYKCHKCTKIFTHKNDYQKHINRKTICLDSSQYFECDKCNRTFTRKDNLTRHILKFCAGKTTLTNCVYFNETSSKYKDDINIQDINSNEDCILSTHKNECTKSGHKRCEGVYKSVQFIVPSKSDKDVNIICSYCKKSYMSKNSLYRHIRLYCKSKKKEQELEHIFQKLLEERDKKIDQLEKKIELISDCKLITNNTVNNTVNNSGTINNIEVKLLAYGKEDKSFLTDKDYMNILNKGFQSVPELVKHIHFNKSKPENFNIYISNMRDSYIMVFNGNKWVLQNKKEIINDLYNSKRDMLIEKYDELMKKLPEKTTRKFDRFINDEQDKKVSDSIKEELKLILYNNKNMIEID